MDLDALRAELETAGASEHEQCVIQQIELEKGYSRSDAIRRCKELGGRLAYRREIVDGPNGQVRPLLINGGKAFCGDVWTPVLDGDRNNDNAGDGWVQVGNAHGPRTGKNHREAHGGDCGWGGKHSAPHWKGRQVWMLHIDWTEQYVRMLQHRRGALVCSMDIDAIREELETAGVEEDQEYSKLLGDRLRRVEMSWQCRKS